MNKQKVLVALEGLRDMALSAEERCAALYVGKISNSREQSDSALEKARQARETIHGLFETIWEEVI